jgi:DNA-binding transcriptional ArsR family regulator
LKKRMSEKTIKSAAKLLSAMENPTRLVILQILLAEEIPVGKLAEKIGLSQSALSQHLSILRGANAVQRRRKAQMIYYCSQSEAVRQVLTTLEEIFCSKSTSSLEAARDNPRA